jgi:hypothetical protein
VQCKKATDKPLMGQFSPQWVIAFELKNDNHYPIEKVIWGNWLCAQV